MTFIRSGQLQLGVYEANASHTLLERIPHTNTAGTASSIPFRWHVFPPTPRSPTLSHPRTPPLSPPHPSYMSIVHDHYADTVNFKVPQTKQWDTLPSPGMRKLFQRLDTREYVQKIEEALNETPGGAERLAAIRSSDESYTAVELVV